MPRTAIRVALISKKERSSCEARLVRLCKSHPQELGGRWKWRDNGCGTRYVNGNGTLLIGIAGGDNARQRRPVLAGFDRFRSICCAAVAGVDYDQLIVNGDMDISEASLSFTGNLSTVSTNPFEADPQRRSFGNGGIQ